MTKEHETCEAPHPKAGRQRREPSDDQPDERELGRTATILLNLRRLRREAFPNSLFGEPAWEMLLELFIRETSGVSTTTDELRMQAQGARSTVARWLKHLESERLVVCWPHPVNHGTSFVELTTSARKALERYLAALRGL